MAIQVDVELIQAAHTRSAEVVAALRLRENESDSFRSLVAREQSATEVVCAVRDGHHADTC